MLPKQRLTKEQALPKIKAYCSYQERSHKEVKDKLYSFGLYSSDVDQVLSQLIEENYLNEERFAKMFAGGKFRMNSWGKTKITYELKQKQVSPYCIKIALKEITDDDYLVKIEKLAAVKWNALKGENLLSKKAKVYSFLLQKGYESPLIQKVIAGLASSGKDNNV